MTALIHIKGMDIWLAVYKATLKAFCAFSFAFHFYEDLKIKFLVSSAHLAQRFARFFMPY